MKDDIKFECEVCGQKQKVELLLLRTNKWLKQAVCKNKKLQHIKNVDR